MPSGTALKSHVDEAANVDRRDTLDGAIQQVLKRAQRSKPPTRSIPPSSPISLPEEKLLRYIDGSLDLPAHQEVERFLLSDADARARIATLSAAMMEVGEATGPAPVGDGRSVRYLFLYKGTGLRFLRGTSWPGCPSGVTQDPPSRPSAPPAPDQAAVVDPPADAPHFDLFHEFGRLLCHLRIEASPDTSLNVQISLQNTSPTCRVRCLRGSRLVQESGLNGDGKVAFFGLMPARYDIEIGTQDLLAGKLVLDIRTE